MRLDSILFGASYRKEVSSRNLQYMRNAFGLLIVLWGLSKFFTTSFEALDGAARESFKLIEATAVSSQEMLEKK